MTTEDLNKYRQTWEIELAKQRPPVRSISFGSQEPLGAHQRLGKLPCLFFCDCEPWHRRRQRRTDVVRVQKERLHPCSPEPIPNRHKRRHGIQTVQVSLPFPKRRFVRGEGAAQDRLMTANAVLFFRHGWARKTVVAAGTLKVTKQIWP